MEENVGKKRKIGYQAALIVYALSFLAVVVTPFLAKPLAKLFDFVELAWSERALLRGFFEAFFTVLLWSLEIWGWWAVMKKIRKKEGNTAEGQAFAEQEIPSDGRSVAEAVEAETATADATKKKNKSKRPKEELLPIKNVAILTAIVVSCLALVTLKIGFNVKPAYDLGEKVTREGIVNMCGDLLVAVMKCIWIQIILRASLQCAEGIFERINCSEKRKNIFSWLTAGGMLFLFGVYDAVMTAGAYVWIYLVFYVAFSAIYYFTKKSSVKSFWLSCFIYIF